VCSRSRWTLGTNVQILRHSLVENNHSHLIPKLCSRIASAWISPRAARSQDSRAARSSFERGLPRRALISLSLSSGAVLWLMIFMPMILAAPVSLR
jgi:hypothetical protein